jgi:hypothetical protein
VHLLCLPFVYQGRYEVYSGLIAHYKSRL